MSSNIYPQWLKHRIKRVERKTTYNWDGSWRISTTTISLVYFGFFRLVLHVYGQRVAIVPGFHSGLMAASAGFTKKIRITIDIKQ